MLGLNHVSFDYKNHMLSIFYLLMLYMCALWNDPVHKVVSEKEILIGFCPVFKTECFQLWFQCLWRMPTRVYELDFLQGPKETLRRRTWYCRLANKAQSESAAASRTFTVCQFCSAYTWLARFPWTQHNYMSYNYM